MFVITSSTGQPASQKSSILSQLAQRFPFIFNLLGGHHLQPNGTQERHSVEGPSLPKIRNEQDSGEMQNGILMDGITDDINMYSEELQMLLSRDDQEIDALRFLLFLVSCFISSYLLLKLYTQYKVSD